MERTNQNENKKSKINRVISYVILGVSSLMLIFCVHNILSYIDLVNENKALTEEHMETSKQNSNYLKEHFDTLKNEDYYSVYVDNEFQYVDSKTDSLSVIE